MPSFTKVLPVLRVSDLSRSVDFYTTVLGFQVLWQAPHDGGGANAMLQVGVVDVLLSTGSHLGSPPRFTGTLYFTVEGIQKYYARVKDQAEVVWPLEAMDYGQVEFGIHDPDGYTLAFAEEVT